jgi:hypothetical protein
MLTADRIGDLIAAQSMLRDTNADPETPEHPAEGWVDAITDQIDLHETCTTDAERDTGYYLRLFTSISAIAALAAAHLAEEAAGTATPPSGDTAC